MQTSAKICSAAAISLFRVIGENNPKDMDNLGLEDELLLELNTLGLTERETLIRNATRFLTLELNIKALRSVLLAVERKRQEREMEDEFLLLCAPLPLMRQLFGIHAAEFSLRRRRLNMAGKGNGRAPAIGEATEHNIWKYWQACKNLDERERYLKTAELSNQNLNTIWATLQRHEFDQYWKKR